MQGYKFFIIDEFFMKYFYRLETTCIFSMKQLHLFLLFSFDDEKIKSNEKFGFHVGKIFSFKALSNPKGVASILILQRNSTDDGNFCENQKEKF